MAAAPADAAALGSPNAKGQPTPDSQDEMPLIWPVLTPEERADVDQPTTASAFAHLAGVFAAVMALAALLGMLLLRISTRRGRRSSPTAKNASLRSSSAPRVHRYDAVAAEDGPYMPGDDQGWQSAPQYAREDRLPELLRQMHRQTHEHAFNMPLASAR